MNKMEPLSVYAESSNRFIAKTYCNGKTENFVFTLDPGPTPVLQRENSFIAKSFENSEICIWITRAVSYFSTAFENRIALQSDFLTPLSIEIGDSTSEATTYVIEFNSQCNERTKQFFEVSRNDSTYSVTGDNGSWQGKFTNMKLDISNEDEALPLIKSILSLQRARDVQSDN